MLGLAIIYAGLAAIVVIDGMTPSGYKGAHMPPGMVWTYPWDDVQFSLTAMTIELAISALYLWLRAETGIWLRAMLLAVLQFFAMFVFGVMAMHATRPCIDHFVYLLFASCYLVLFAIGSKVAAIIVEHRRARSLDLKAFD